MLETYTRTLLRTLSYRILALLITAAWTGLGSALMIHFVLFLMQYVVERIWLKIHWGLNK